MVFTSSQGLYGSHRDKQASGATQFQSSPIPFYWRQNSLICTLTRWVNIVALFILLRLQCGYTYLWGEDMERKRLLKKRLMYLQSIGLWIEARNCSSNFSRRSLCSWLRRSTCVYIYIVLLYSYTHAYSVFSVRSVSPT